MVISVKVRIIFINFIELLYAFNSKLNLNSSSEQDNLRFEIVSTPEKEEEKTPEKEEEKIQEVFFLLFIY